MEIERKFLVNKEYLLLNDLSKYNKYNIEQAYISTEDNEVRIRKIGLNNIHNNKFILLLRYIMRKIGLNNNKCYMTIKSKGNLSRQEVEFKISCNKYQDIINYKMYKGNIIIKSRYKIPLKNDLIAELDIYNKDLLGLITVEVEFKTEEEAEQFEKPDWFGEEVTNDKRYKNKNLALGLLDNN